MLHCRLAGGSVDINRSRHLVPIRTSTYTGRLSHNSGPCVNIVNGSQYTSPSSNPPQRFSTFHNTDCRRDGSNGPKHLRPQFHQLFQP